VAWSFFVILQTNEKSVVVNISLNLARCIGLETHVTQRRNAFRMTTFTSRLCPAKWQDGVKPKLHQNPPFIETS
jgi:hypothetical protein